jgi:glycosyltransferase involved in cell wall biosynthesis
LHLAVFPDFAEEEWFSMDLCAELLVRELAHGLCTPQPFVPHFSRPVSGLTKGKIRRVAFNAERLWNRFVNYPSAIKKSLRSPTKPGSIAKCDAFHVVDHTYAQLVHALPAERTGVYCHDLDAFLSILEPKRDPRPWWFRAMARKQLAGLQKAAIVFHSTMPVRQRILELNLVSPDKLVHAPYGIADEFIASKTLEQQPLSNKLQEAKTLGGKLESAWHESPWILHVGSSIPRKRIDVLLNILAKTRQKYPALKLVKVGGQWSDVHQQIIERNKLSDAIIYLSDLNRWELAELYRDASAVLVPSEAEGFGLPVIEAMACGAQVLCSDIPVLREVGGEYATYATTAQVDEWLIAMLDSPASTDRKQASIGWAQKYSWRNHAEIIANAYSKLIATHPKPSLP